MSEGVQPRLVEVSERWTTSWMDDHLPNYEAGRGPKRGPHKPPTVTGGPLLPPLRTELRLTLRGCVFYLVGYMLGVRYRRSTFTDDPVRAGSIQNWLLFRAEGVQFHGLDPLPTTLLEARERYNAAIKPSPVESKRLDFILEFAGSGFTCAEIDQHWVDRLYRAKYGDRVVADATRLRDPYTPLMAMLQYAFDMHMIPAMPTLDRPADSARRTGFLEPKDFRALVSASSEQFAHLLLVMSQTGGRRASMAKLRWTDVDFDHGYILLRSVKAGHNDVVNLRLKLFPKPLQALLACLAKAKDKKGAVFTTARGTAFKGPAAFGKWFSEEADKAAALSGIEGVGVRSQIMRRTCATYDYSAFGSIAHLMGVGGWSSYSMADTYRQSSKPEMKPDVLQIWGIEDSPESWKVDAYKEVVKNGEKRKRARGRQKW